MSEVQEKPNKLPNGWAEKTLGDLGEYINGRGFKKSEWASVGLPIIRIQDLTGTGKEQNYYNGEIEGRHVVEPGDLLISWSATLGAYIWDGPKAALNQHIFKVETNIDKKLHYYLIQHILDDLYRQTHGSGMVHITKTKFEKTPVLVPETEEQQKQIVAKIEELFSHIDVGIEALKKAKKLLKQYRQSVLKAAVTGELTKEWREANSAKLEPASQLLERILKERRHKWEEQQLKKFKAKGKIPKDDKWKGKYKEAELPDVTDLPEIPASWKWVELQHVFDVITDGDHQAPPKAGDGVPFLVIGDVNKGVINFGDKRFVPRSYYDALAEIRRPRKGDLLYTVVGSFGIPVKVESDKEFCVQRHIAILKSSSQMSVNFLYHMLSSGFIYKQAADVSTGTAQKTVPLGGLRELKIPLPPYEEQMELESLIENKLEAISRMDKESTGKIFMAGQNKKAILASAFSGRLASNWVFQ
jgi:type I restriction enzyme S subunit